MNTSQLMEFTLFLLFLFIYLFLFFCVLIPHKGLSIRMIKGHKDLSILQGIVKINKLALQIQRIFAFWWVSIGREHEHHLPCGSCLWDFHSQIRIFEDVLMSTMMCLIILIDFLVSCNGFNFCYLESIALIHTQIGQTQKG